MEQEIVIGTTRLPVNAVEAIEPWEGSDASRLSGVAVFVVLAGILGIVAGAVVGRPEISFASLVVGGLGVFGHFAARRKLYGWRIRCFHRPEVIAAYDSARDAEQMLAYLRTHLPGIQVVRPANTAFWWVEF